MAKFVTDASGATWWPNLEPMQVAFFLLAAEITQVKEAIPWVRCASGNVFPPDCQSPPNAGFGDPPRRGSHDFAMCTLKARITTQLNVTISICRSVPMFKPRRQIISGARQIFRQCSAYLPSSTGVT